MDLKLTDEQQMLRETLREMLAKHSSPEIVRVLEDDATGYRRELWDELSKMGVVGLTVPEHAGGAGQSPLEVALVYEELGRALAWTPHFVSGILAAGLLEAGDSPAARQEWLPRICAGEAIVTPAWIEPEGGFGPESVQATVSAGAISGRKIMVSFASVAARLIVFARDESGEVSLYLVDPSGPGVTLTQEHALASDAVFEVVLDAAPGERIAGWHAWETTAPTAWIALAAYCIGGARAAHEMAVSYAKERVQFDRPIGSFQAIAHPLADTIAEIEGGATLVHQAAWVLANGGRRGEGLAAMAKLFCAEAFKKTTKLGQQIFRGIGFTRDIDMQLYFRRAKQLEIAWWDPRFLEERVAAAELDADVPLVGVDTGLS